MAYWSGSSFALESLLGSFYGSSPPFLSVGSYPRFLVPEFVPLRSVLLDEDWGFNAENARVSVQVSNGGS